MLATGGISLLTARLVIVHAGTTTYAFFALVTSLLAVLPFADLGTGAALVNTIAKSVNPREDDEVRNTVRTVVSTLWLSATLIVVASLALCVTSAWPSLLGDVQQQPSGLVTGIVLGLVLFAFSLPVGVGQRALVATHQSHLATLTTSLATPLTLASAALLLRTVPSRPGVVVLSSAFGLVCAQFVTTALAQRRTGIRLLWQPLALTRPRNMRVLARTTVPWLVITAGLPLGLGTDRLVLSHLVGVEGVATYSVVAQLYAPSYALVSAAALPLWALFRSQSDSNSAKRLWLRTLGFLGGLGFLGAAALIFLGPAGVALISDGRIGAPLGLLASFGLLLFIQALHLPSGMFLTDHRGLSFQAWCVGLALPVNLILSVMLAARLGAAGPVIGSAASVLLVQAVPCFLYARRRIRGAQFTHPELSANPSRPRRSPGQLGTLGVTRNDE